MRYLNRRRVLMVTALGALVGAAAPYVISIVSVLRRVDMRFRERILDIGEHNQSFMLLQDRRVMQEQLTSYHMGVPPDTEWNWLVSEHDNLVPNGFRQRQQPDLLGQLTIYQFGWPFRAAYYCVSVGEARIAEKTPASKPTVAEATTTYSALKWADTGLTLLHWNSPTKAPACLPLGVRWAGLAGNVIVSVLFFGALYFGLANLRARRRIKRGQCWKCGYLSKGAAVCPECGEKA